VLDLEELRSVLFNIDVAYVAGGGTPHGRYVMYQFSYIKYCQFLILTFIICLL
jgi:hypothetical protein